MRLTLDWDDIDNETFRNRIIKMIKSFLNSKIEAYKTKHGYHVIVHDLNIEYKKLKILRQAYSDDWRRIKIDNYKKKSPKQVLWTKKKGYVPKLIFKME